MPERQIVYFHGFPGGPEEVQAFGAFSIPMFAPDRRNDAADLDFLSYVDHLAKVIDMQFPSGSITLIGFSAGARMALELAVMLEARVKKIILISAAAPLQSGDYLRDMAGRSVFSAAQRAPLALRALTWAQAQLAVWAPDKLFQSVFASARGFDDNLKFDASFKNVIQSVIVKTLQSGAIGYQREILAYVAPWGDLICRVKAPVTVWHGIADNWTPIGMADAFEAALPNLAAIHRLPNLSHYSTLQACLQSLEIA